MATKPALDKKEVFTTGEAASLCRLSLQTIIRCFDQGKVKGYRVPGSRFRRIPRESLVAFAEENGIPLPEEFRAPARTRVLLVDDDPMLVKVIEDYFEAAAHIELEVAATGFEAGAKTLSFKPEVILLDMMLPDINGREVLRSIKSNPETAAIKVIAISGMIEEDKIAELYECGIELYLGKPFNLEDLSRAISRIAAEP